MSAKRNNTWSNRRDDCIAKTPGNHHVISPTQRKSWQPGRKNNQTPTPAFTLCQYSKLGTGTTLSIATNPETSTFHTHNNNSLTLTKMSSHPLA
ncbi:unnamed protein product [Mycena citricolor]|uniref:Uncharacterized protein n=1 Tax=Mycena citricolor TaxID=2018698 RepID=A0AAD2K2N6_9AGAR|nr:unnamed protein product [Mycena citricolor]